MRKLLNEEAREGPGSVGGENWGTRLSQTTLRCGGGFFNRNSFGAALARNLHALGADDLTIQRILRHSNVAVRSESATSRRCLSKALPGCAAWKLRSTRCRGCPWRSKAGAASPGRRREAGPPPAGAPERIPT